MPCLAFEAIEQNKRRDERKTYVVSALTADVTPHSQRDQSVLLMWEKWNARSLTRTHWSLLSDYVLCWHSLMNLVMTFFLVDWRKMWKKIPKNNTQTFHCQALSGLFTFSFALGCACSERNSTHQWAKFMFPLHLFVAPPTNVRVRGICVWKNKIHLMPDGGKIQ